MSADTRYASLGPDGRLLDVTAGDIRRAGHPRVPPGRAEFLDWECRRRSGDALDVEHPLLQVHYRLASGQLRTGWIDVLGLDWGRPS
jgi:hypothetical protein